MGWELIFPDSTDKCIEDIKLTTMIELKSVVSGRYLVRSSDVQWTTDRFREILYGESETNFVSLRYHH